MPRNLIGALPFPPLVVFDEDRPFAIDDLQRIMNDRTDGVSICIRYPEGPAKRGGYFFHFKPTSDAMDHYTMYDFEKRPVASFSPDSLVKFIDHCTGRRFDQESFDLCQTELNFLKDEEPNA